MPSPLMPYESLLEAAKDDWAGDLVDRIRKEATYDRDSWLRVGPYDHVWLRPIAFGPNELPGDQAGAAQPLPGGAIPPAPL